MDFVFGIGKARELSNFRLEGESFGLQREAGFSRAIDFPATTVNKIVRFVRGAARRARKLDGEAPRRSSRSAGRNYLSLRVVRENLDEPSALIPALHSWCRRRSRYPRVSSLAPAVCS